MKLNRIFLLTVTVLLYSVTAQAESSKPNILVIFSEELSGKEMT